MGEGGGEKRKLSPFFAGTQATVFQKLLRALAQSSQNKTDFIFLYYYIIIFLSGNSRRVPLV